MRRYKIRNCVSKIGKSIKGSGVNSLKMAVCGNGMEVDDTNLDRLRESLRKMNLSSSKKKKRFIEL